MYGRAGPNTVMAQGARSLGHDLLEFPVCVSGRAGVVVKHQERPVAVLGHGGLPVILEGPAVDRTGHESAPVAMATTSVPVGRIGTVQLAQQRWPLAIVGSAQIPQPLPNGQFDHLLRRNDQWAAGG